METASDSPSSIPDFCHSLSFPSEPPHIKNWCSSYVYESPVSNTADGFAVCATEASEYEKDGSPVEGSCSEREENFDGSKSYGSNPEAVAGEKLPMDGFVILDTSLRAVKDDNGVCKIPESSQLSGLSEPPDIGNWFSSYVYDPPDLGESIQLVNETEYDIEDEFVNQISKDLQETGRSSSIKGVSTGYLEDDNLENQCSNKGNIAISKEDAFAQDNSCGQREQCWDKTSSLNDETHIVRQQEKQNLPGESGFPALKRYTKENVEPKAQRDAGFASGANNVMLLTVTSEREGTHKMNDRENEPLGNGFVTTRKNRIVRPNNENLFTRPPKIPLRCSKNKRAAEGDKENDVAVRGNVLSEITNFEPSGAVEEVTGKWKCPQKSKPCIRPPLKQLRLEQWVSKQP